MNSRQMTCKKTCIPLCDLTLCLMVPKEGTWQSYWMKMRRIHWGNVMLMTTKSISVLQEAAEIWAVKTASEYFVCGAWLWKAHHAVDISLCKPNEIPFFGKWCKFENNPDVTSQVYSAPLCQYVSIKHSEKWSVSLINEKKNKLKPFLKRKK